MSGAAQVALRFERDAASRTFLARKFATYPFFLAAPFHLDRAPHGMLTAIMQSSSGGLYEGDRLVLTYLAILAGPLRTGGFEAVSVARAELARGTAREAPSTIDVSQVVEHGLRHLSWLSRDDPAIREGLSPAWLAFVDRYQPEPFRAL